MSSRRAPRQRAPRSGLKSYRQGVSSALQILRLSAAGGSSSAQIRAALSLRGPVAVTIGNFDGLHVGHHEVISRLVSMVRLPSVAGEQSGHTVVLSFYPHPSVVLGKAQRIPQITPLHQKAAILAASGVTVFLLMRFTPALARLTAAQFLDQYVIGLLGATHAVLGPDTALGRNREGTTDFIADYLGRAGVETARVAFRQELGDRVSSRRIRSLLEAGEVRSAAQLLGRPYTLEGRVQAGEARGRTIGVPTANIRPSIQVMPRHGVYAALVRTQLAGQFAAVTNIGTRPTVSRDGRVTIESHLFDFSGDLYGQRIEVSLVERIRDEQRFETISELREQIARDMAKAKELVRL
ncbi:MAG: riboflavin biosynthesis protein RibF [Proteobacteria bacterium]|nr:riboflavin biosynthesis protein RibF [Pseudomonadota bacterium]